MTLETDDFLAHYGVKGMKWGVRRSRAELDKTSTKTKQKKTFGQKLNQSKFGDLSRANFKRHNDRVKKAEARAKEQTSRQAKIRKTAKVTATIASVTPYVVIAAGAAYTKYLMRENSSTSINSLSKPNIDTQKSVRKLLDSFTSTKPFNMNSWNDPDYVYQL